MAPTTTDPRPLVRIRAPRISDGRALWALARANGLDENSPYAYLLWTAYFGEASVVAVDADDEPVGFVTGFVPPADGEAVFVWQVGVAESHRRQGIAGRMLDELFSRTGASYLEATVTPTNTASETLFRRFAERHSAPVATDELFPAELFPAGHEAEVRFRIGPVDTL